MTSTNVTDLRSYLTVLEQAGELSRVKVPVNLEQEIGAICLRNLRAGGPGLLFERPGDRTMPLAVDLLASRRRYALALGIEADQLAVEWNRRTAKLLAPVIVERGAVVAFLTSLVVIVIALIAHVVGSKVGIGGER